MKHIGILAHSAEGSALCYLTACQEGIRRLGAHLHPDITLDYIAMGQSMDAWEKGDLASIRATLSRSLDRLAAAGADFFVCPDNTAHLALEAPGDPFPLPGLHIAEIVAERAAAEGFKKIGVLGTNWTMEGPIYREALQRVGSESLTPSEEDRSFIDKVIFDELCNGVFAEKSRQEYVRIIDKLADTGCDAVILGCTEIPLLVTPEVSPLPTLDSTRLLATAAVEVALEARTLPDWRGGAVAA